jgi:hypothetical protein
MIQVVLNAWGIGDALTGLFAVRSLAKRGEVRYVVKTRLLAYWASYFHNNVSTEEIPGLKTLYPNDAYALEHTNFPVGSRIELYCQCCGVEPVMPKLIKSLYPCKKEWQNRFIIAPISMWRDRIYPRWAEVEELLANPLIMDTSLNRIEHFKGEKAASLGPPVAMSLLRKSCCLLSNDSGMAHLAGILGSPALVVCGPTKGARIFDYYPSIKVLQGFDVTPEKIVEEAQGWAEKAAAAGEASHAAG